MVEKIIEFCAKNRFLVLLGVVLAQLASALSPEALALSPEALAVEPSR